MALALGGRTVEELSRDLSEREFGEWMEYARISPFGNRADWQRTGILAALTANVHRDPKQSKAYSPADFIPGGKAEEVKGVQSKILRTELAAVFGDRIKSASG